MSLDAPSQRAGPARAENGSKRFVMGVQAVDRIRVQSA
jgi:hypothetical protein